jgi:hypothetical protein
MYALRCSSFGTQLQSDSAILFALNDKLAMQYAGMR